MSEKNIAKVVEHFESGDKEKEALERAELRATEIQSRCASSRRAPAFPLYQNRIKTLSETSIRVVCRAKSRFPRLLERLRKRETEWTDWKVVSRAQAGAQVALPGCAALSDTLSVLARADCTNFCTNFCGKRCEALHAQAAIVASAFNNLRF